MIEFMVIAAPRSGTAWAANWLTTTDALCMHDPLFRYHYTELDALSGRFGKKHFGIACTGSALYPDWLNAHPARKVILRRSLHEVDESLTRLGLPPVSQTWSGKLEQINGMHVHWKDLFRNPRPIWEHLLPEVPFDQVRHDMLADLDVQSRFEAIEVKHEAVGKLYRELQAIAEQAKRR